MYSFPRERSALRTNDLRSAGTGKDDELEPSSSFSLTVLTKVTEGKGSRPVVGLLNVYSYGGENQYPIDTVLQRW